MNEQLFYLQDSRSYCGNDIFWWAEKGGYTTDLSKAEVFTKEKAVSQHQCRESDVPWPKEYIDKRTRPAVDMQYVFVEEALRGTGIELIEPKPFPKIDYRFDGCGIYGCGILMTDQKNYESFCDQCDMDNIS